MSVAQAFGIGVVAAALNNTRRVRLFTVGAVDVSVAQLALIVLLAQAMRLHRLCAIFRNALVRLFADAAADRPDGRDAALELHVMRLAVAARFVRPITSGHRAGVVFFEHKKTPIGS